jgi:hypothetical protein
MNYNRRGDTLLATLIGVAVALLLFVIIAIVIGANKPSFEKSVPFKPYRVCKVVALKDHWDRTDHILHVHVAYAGDLKANPVNDLGLVAEEAVDVLNISLSKNSKQHPEVIYANLRVGSWYSFTMEDGVLPNVISFSKIHHLPR